MERLQTTTTTNNEPQTYYIHKQAIIEVGKYATTTNKKKYKLQQAQTTEIVDVMYLPKI